MLAPNNSPKFNDQERLVGMLLAGMTLAFIALIVCLLFPHLSGYDVRALANNALVFLLIALGCMARVVVEAGRMG